MTAVSLSVAWELMAFILLKYINIIIKMRNILILIKKSFTESIDNDYYLHVFKGRSFMLTSGKHDIAHIASSVYFSQPRAGFFLSIFAKRLLY